MDSQGFCLLLPGKPALLCASLGVLLGKAFPNLRPRDQFYIIILHTRFMDIIDLVFVAV